MGCLSSLAATISRYTEQEEEPLASLTAREQQLIEYPPTETTWLCVHVEGYTSSNGERREIKRGYANAGSRRTCGFCAKPKPRNPKLVWPEYQAALAKLPKEAAPSGA